MEKDENVVRLHAINKVTIEGSLINVFLLVFKFIAGILGGSAAMIADALHSLSDFLSDIVMLVFVRLSNRPKDKDHDFGHGKYETLATALIGIALLCVGAMICIGGLEKIIKVVNGASLPCPGVIAFVAAVVSILLKEWCFQFTAKVGKRYNSQAGIANAWHHRSDALSSIGTMTGIGLAYFLGDKWRIADPIAALIVAVFIFKVAFDLIRTGLGELLERSLPDETEQEILGIVTADPEVGEPHNLRTRRIGAAIAVEVHVRVDGAMSVARSHELTVDIERRLRARFGQGTIISIHVEPVKCPAEAGIPGGDPPSCP